MIGIVAYPSNFRSIGRALEFLDLQFKLIYEPIDLIGVTHLVLPGQANFGDAMRFLSARGLGGDVIDLVATSSLPVLAICAGFHILVDKSDEAPGVDGLGILDGFKVAKINFERSGPNIGFRKLQSLSQEVSSPKVPDVGYFAHSYGVFRVDREEKIHEVGCAENESFGFVETKIHKRITGVQWHPEKSHISGILFIRDWAIVNSV